MNSIARIGVVFFSFSLCVGSAIVGRYSAELVPDFIALDPASFANGYEQVASSKHDQSLFNRFEALIRRDPLAMSHRGRIEFGSVKISGATAEVEVLFFGADGQVRPVLYKLIAEKNVWKVASAQRMWFVPRSHLLRGLRV